MPNIYVGCNVLVVPSLREPFGNVVLEAMASGRPVIGSYVGGMKDTIVHGETGYHVPPGNTKMLSDFLLEILSDESLSVKLGKNARKRVLESYDSKTIAKRVEKIYTDAIS
jgi:glycosyltransferase involved in cell wall biosynthesis